MADGWSRLGAALAGGGASREDAYERGAQRAVSLEAALANAQIKRDTAMKRAALKQSAIDSGIDPNMAGMLDAALGAGYNPNEIGQYRLADQKVGINDRAVQSVIDANGASPVASALTGIAAGKPLELTKIEDHTAVSPYAPADGQQFAPTAIGQAVIGSTNALSTQRNAAANAATVRAGAYANNQNAHAGLANTQSAAGGFNPNSASGEARRIINEINSHSDELGEEHLTPEQEISISQAIIHGRAIPSITTKKKGAASTPVSLQSIIGGSAPTVAPFSMIGGGNGYAPGAPASPAGQALSPADAARISTVGGKPVVSVNSPDEAKAAWAKLPKGSGLRFPNGTIKFK